MKKIEFEDALIVEPAKVSVLDELPVGSVIEYEGDTVPEGFEYLENQAISKGFSNTSSIKITSINGYGTVFIVSSMFVCIVQLQSNTTNIIDIYGNHGEMNTSIKNNEATLSGLYNWDHYIVLASDSISKIEKIN